MLGDRGINSNIHPLKNTLWRNAFIMVNLASTQATFSIVKYTNHNVPSAIR